MARDVDKLKTEPDETVGTDSKPSAPPDTSMVDKQK
jgi:hypothetical protein